MSIQAVSPESKSQPQVGLERRMHGLTLYLARGIYIVVFLIILGLSIRGIPDTIKILDSLGRPTTFIMARFILIYLVGFGIVSLFLFLRRSDDWLVFSVALALLIYGGTTSLLNEGARSIGLYPLSDFLTLASTVLNIFLCLTFPNGVFVPAWTRKFFWFVLLLGLVSFFLNSFEEHIPWLLQNSSAWNIIDWVWQLFWGVGIYAQIHRFRYVSNPIERQQVKWLLTVLPIAFLLATVHMLFLNFYSANLNPSKMLITIDVIWRSLIGLADLFVAIAAGLAVYRYKLWESDFYLNRTLIYGTVTALLAGLWWFGAIPVQLFINNFTKQQSSPMMVALLSGIPAATLFQPLRDNTKKWVNSRIYKDQVDLTQAIVELQPENWHFIGLHDMVQAVMKNTARLLEIDRSAIYTFDGESMRLMNSNGITPGQASQFNEMPISELQKGKVIQLGERKPLYHACTPGGAARACQ
jgi:hypothetical protein